MVKKFKKMNSSPPDHSAEGLFFEEDYSANEVDNFTVELDGFEGPLHLLLSLAREQKVDIRQISILELAEQYLTFIDRAKLIRIEIAADYLVMAAWLAYLKSRLLIPESDTEEENTGTQLAERLQHQLRRLSAMRDAAELLMNRNLLGREIFPRGAPEGIQIIRESVLECSLYDLLKAYGSHVTRSNAAGFRLRPRNIMSVEEAIKRLTRLLGEIPDWTSIETFFVSDLTDGVEYRSSIAATFAGCLELAKQGDLGLRQSGTYAPIFLKRLDK